MDKVTNNPHSSAIQSLIGYYFIVTLPLFGMKSMLRGKIRGPLVHELSNLFLCDIYPSDTESLDIQSTMVLTIEQLVGAHLQTDKALWEIEWARMLKDYALFRSQQQAEAAAAKRKASNPHGRMTIVNLGVDDAE